MRKFVNFLIKSVVALLLAPIAALAAIVGWLVWHYEYEIDVPDHRNLAIVSATGRICSSGGKRIFVPLATVPSIVRNAFLAAEEPDFYGRSPFNPFTEFAGAILGVRRPIRATISMAVAKCLMSSSPDCCGKTFDRQISTIILMHRVERDLPKDIIFEYYLNEIWFGRGAYGAGAAATTYFGKSLSDLTLDEAAYIAALPRAPYNLAGNIERGTERRNFVLDRMAKAGTISPAQAASAKQQPLLLREAPAPI